jgi:hypothetical protein
MKRKLTLDRCRTIPLTLPRIRTYPALHFTIIINPNSGPGGTPHPDACYAPEIRRLTVHPNVTIVGYIRINYCKKPLAAVYEEIATYAGWGGSEQGLGVQGIFFDETPNLYQPDVKAYLDAVSGRVKGVPGLGKRMVSAVPRHVRGERPAFCGFF